MKYFIDEMLLDSTLTIRLYNSRGGTLLGVSPLTSGFGFSISHDWSNTSKFNPFTTLMSAISGARESFRAGAADLSLALDKSSDILSMLGLSGVSDAAKEFAGDLNNNSASVNAADYRKYFRGSDVSPEGVKSITLLFISGMTFNGVACNVRNSIESLIDVTIGELDRPGDKSQLGTIIAPNEFTFSEGFQEDTNGSFYINYGASILIPNLLVSSVEVNLSPLLTTEGDYYYATATVGLTPSRKFHKEDIKKWLTIGGGQ